MASFSRLARRVSGRFGQRLDPYLLLTLLLTLFALGPLLAPGYFFSTHDGRHSVFYTLMFDESFRDGALWPRWAMHHNQGYGYPTFVIQAPLAFYVAEFFMLLGAGPTLAVKLGWAVGFGASAWGIYALVNHWQMPREGENRPTTTSSPLPGVVAALLYIYLPYRFLDIYVRGAYAEFMVMAWIPWVFLAFDRLLQRGLAPGWGGRLALAALTLAGLLLTHVFALLAFPPLLVAFVLFRLGQMGVASWRRGQFRPTLQRGMLALGAGMAALLLFAVFLLPLLTEGPLLDQEVYVRETYEYQRHWVYWGQFFNPFWGYGYSDDPIGVNDGMGFQIGVMAGLLALTGIYSLFWQKWKEDRSTGGLIPFLLAATGGLLWIVTPWAAPVWAAIPPLAVLQFPWRLLAFAGFTLSALGGLVLGQLAKSHLPEEGEGALVAVGLLIILAGLPFAQVQSLQPVEPWREDGRAIFQFEEQHPDMFGYTGWVKEPFASSPLTADYAHPDFRERGFSGRFGVTAGQGQVLSQNSRGQSVRGVVRMAEAGVVQIRTYFFPGWRAQIDGVSTPIRVSDPYGLMEVDVAPGEHLIELRFGSTPVRNAGTLITWATLLVLLGVWIGEKKWGKSRLYTGKLT